MKEAISTWIAALRSGEYNQAQSSLYDENSCSFCCLGVYAQVNGLADFKLHDFSLDIDQNSIYKEIYETVDHDFAWSLIRLNDSSGFNFNQIADVIEEEYSK